MVAARAGRIAAIALVLRPQPTACRLPGRRGKLPVMKGEPTPPGDAPGTLTSLVQEVFRGSGDVGPEAWADLEPGTALGRYDLNREVGRGGFGVVWEARDREIGRRVAVKVLRTDRSQVPGRRQLAEAEVAGRLSHPNVVTLLDVGRSDKAVWIVQEFLVGRTLAARLDEGPLPLPEALHVAVGIARGLAHAHAHGVVHRDLTPRNVFLCDDGQVKLLDLGIAQAFGFRRLEGGTPDYMAPEQAVGAPQDERVDVFSLGVIIHRMLTGRDPFGGARPGARPPVLRLETDGAPGLGGLVDRMLAPDPRDRPRDAEVVLEELAAMERALPRAGSGTAVRGASGRASAVRVQRRWPVWAVALALVVALAAAGGIGALGARRWLSPAIEPVAWSAESSPGACEWGSATWYDLDREPAGAIVRQSPVGKQGVEEVAGRKAWLQTADWNQLILPLGKAAEGDPFAVEVEFFMPPATEWQRGVGLHVFTDPVGGPSRGDALHGVALSLKESPGQPPVYAWYSIDSPGVNGNIYTQPRHQSVAGRWHTLRIEGSRSKGWFRTFLDGRPLVVARGTYDLSGKHVILGSGYGYMQPENVAWSNLRTFAGPPECQ